MHYHYANVAEHLKLRMRSVVVAAVVVGALNVGRRRIRSFVISTNNAVFYLSSNLRISFRELFVILFEEKEEGCIYIYDFFTIFSDLFKRFPQVTDLIYYFVLYEHKITFESHNLAEYVRCFSCIFLKKCPNANIATINKYFYVHPFDAVSD